MTAVVPEANLEQRLDRLTLLVEDMYAELQAQREARERWAELNEVMVPVTRAAFDSVSREMEDLSEDVTIEDAIRFARTAARALPQMERLLAQLETMTELGSEATKLSGAMMAKVSDALDQAEKKGYFTFAQGGMAIADKVVTSFDEDDIEALGDNVVLILNTVKQMTQPEIMTMLRRTMVTVQEDQLTDVKPPGTFALLREMRDPDVRRGLARTLHMLRSIGLESRPDQITQK
ncbi:MAG: DUF1641 domain-containing protein [Candidatus Nanopelagicales bacterium]